ncbi:hypothetical protein COO60DRAFT_100118 [Scenedesmus sp. NREL 46B-D3]|nr:hypothetical protein COO60DRAFT_100118 [Scenedesmus sp. NREL 46B-D3]
MGQPREFLLWRPGWRDAVRGFFLSEHFQGAMQLAMGILFVSLFVLVSALRFPGSCVAVLLYIVVAVTAAPDNHVGTRIFISGFMLGPMWLAIIIGAAVTTIAKLMPSPEAHMVVLCVLGPLAIVPFAVARVGTGHLYLWAMGLVSALYVGMPIIVGFPLRGVAELWVMVLFIIIAALVAMFAGSVLSMLVLPTLASHALEDEVALALRQLGHHLSATTSFLFRTQVSCPAALLPGHLQGMHPLLVHDADPTALAPGLLERRRWGSVLRTTCTWPSWTGLSGRAGPLQRCPSRRQAPRAAAARQEAQRQAARPPKAPSTARTQQDWQRLWRLPRQTPLSAGVVLSRTAMTQGQTKATFPRQLAERRQ